MALTDNPPAAERLTDAERYALYDAAVLSPAFEVAFFERAFSDAFSRTPTVLREDFCGTAAISRAFAESNDERRAVGVDIDITVLNFARQHIPERLSASVKLVEANVCELSPEATGHADVVSAQNFSWCGLHSRDALLHYFERSVDVLNEEGLLVLDLMGGAQREVAGSCDRRDVGPCVVSFRQETFDPICRRARFHLDFTLRGKTHREAFTYDWRLWTIPETTDVMRQAGFDDVVVYWEKRDAFGAATSDFAPVLSASGRTRFVCYLVGVKRGVT